MSGDSREAYDALEAARFQSQRLPYSEGLHWLVKEYLDIFRVHSKINVWKILVIMFFYFLIKIYRALCGPNGVKLNSKPLEKVEYGFWRQLFELLNFSFGLLTLVITVPYSRLDGSETYLCFWAYCAIMCTSVPVMSKNRKIRRFVMKYVFYFSMGVSACANWAYFYYGFFNGKWDYFTIHVIPPIWIVIFYLINIREFDDEVNPLCGHPVLTAFSFTIYLSIIASWRHFNIPHVIYSMFHMEDLYYNGATFPVAVNLALLTLFCLARALWCRLQKVDIKKD
eukprot:gene7906-12374_t